MRWVVNAWRSWISCGKCIIPTWMYLPGLRRTWATTVKIGSWAEIANDEAVRDLKAKSGNHPIDVILSNELVLERSVQVPKALNSKIASALKLNLQRALPVDVEQFDWRYSLGTIDGAQQNVKQVIVKKDNLYEIEKSLSAMGLNIRTISADAALNLPPFFDNRQKLDKPITLWRRLAFIFCFGILGYIGFQEHSSYSKLKDKVNARSAKVFEAREQLVVSIAENKETAEQLENFQKAIAHLIERRSRGSVLKDVSNSFPLDAWVSEFELSENALSLGGFVKSDIADVLQDLNSTTTINNSVLSAALSNGGSNSRRFRISATVDVSVK